MCLLWKELGCGQDFLEEGGRSWSDSSLAVRGMPGCFLVISYHFFLTRGCQIHHKARSHQLCFRSKLEGRGACFFLIPAWQLCSNNLKARQGEDLYLGSQGPQTTNISVLTIWPWCLCELWCIWFMIENLKYFRNKQQTTSDCVEIQFIWMFNNTEEQVRNGVSYLQYVISRSILIFSVDNNWTNICQKMKPVT